MRTEIAAEQIIQEFITQPWLIVPAHGEALAAQVRSRLNAAVLALSVQRRPVSLRVEGGTAVIPIRGVLLRQVPDWMAFFGIEATSYLDIQRLVSQAAADPQIERILLDVDSPGGAVPGVEETGDLIRSVRGRKPIEAGITEIGTSAAYWLAAQTDRITAAPNSWTGSIGVYTVYYDYSKEFEREGVEAHVIASGPFKATGVIGSRITPEQVAKIKEGIMAIAERFIAAVSAGRRIPAQDARALATGQLWQPQGAMENKLIDAIGVATIAPAATAGSGNPKNPKESSMDNPNQQAPAAAPTIDLDQVRAEAVAAEQKRLAELKAAFPGDPAFALEQFAAGHDVTQAKAAYCDVLAERLKDKGTQTADGEDYQHGGYTDGQAAAGGTVTGGFLKAVRDYAREHKCTRIEALKAVKAENPALYDAFRAQSRPPMVHGRCKRVSVSLGS